jgi:hypothetical protein
VLGIALTAPALTGLAERMNTTSRCFDENADGTIGDGECLGDYQAELAVPAGAHSLGIPIRRATVNWNHPMVSHAFLSKPRQDCRPLRTPRAYADAGYYPTTYCVRYDALSATLPSKVEGLVHQQAG